MFPITSVAKPLPFWLLGVSVTIIAFIFIKWISVAREDRKENSAIGEINVLASNFEITRVHPWVKLTQWGMENGRVLKIKILNQTHIVISDEKIAQDLLEDRGLLYGNRPWLSFMCGLLTGNLHLLLLSYNDRFRRYRNFLQSAMLNTAAVNYDSIQIIEAKRMLDFLITAPKQYNQWLDRFSSSLATRLIWGKRVDTGEEEFLRTLQDITGTFGQIGTRGSLVYNRIPLLLLLPDWIAPLKTTARRLLMWETKFLNRLVNDTRLDMAAGITQPSLTRHFIENKAATGLSETEGAFALAGVFEAGSGIVAAQMKSFCLSLCLYPEWQDKMQTEVDAICGERMPEFSDMPSLPITRAVLVEVARWRPVCPGGLPHALGKDDTYGSTLFLSGTVFHPNIWAMTRNSTLYPAPENFNPARWLTPSYPTFRSPLSQYPSISLTPTPIFGYGPRRCPGIHFAEKSLFIQAAYVIWACTLKLRPGARVDVDELFYPLSSETASSSSYAISSALGSGMGMGALLQPKRWDFDIVPRKGREQIVRKEALNAAEMDPLARVGRLDRVDRIAFKRKGAWNPSY